MIKQDSKIATDRVGADEPQTDVAALKADLVQLRMDLGAVASGLVARSKQAIQGAGSAVGQHAQDSVKQAQEFVRKRPVGTALVALGVGVLVGVLVRRR